MRADQGGPEATEEPAAADLGFVREGLAVDERLASGDELGPRAREGARQREGDHPVVEQLESGREPADGPGLYGAAFEKQRRLRVLDIRGCGRLRCEASSDRRAADERGNR